MSRAGWMLLCALFSLCGCGGGGVLDNPPTIANPAGTRGQVLSFAYFQACIQPILEAPLTIKGGGSAAGSVNTCASAGCHDNRNGTGGALRLTAGVPPIDLADPLATPAAVRASAMYRNFYSAQGETQIGSPEQSLLLAKPRLANVLHGGGLIFDRDDDEAVRRIAYWISHPMPQGQDEFSAAAAAMFSPADVRQGACNIQ